MQFFNFLPPQFYSTFYVLLLTILALIISLFYLVSNDNHHIRTDNVFPRAIAILLALFLIFFLGLRPLNHVFVDMLGYKIKYENFSSEMKPFSMQDEWLFQNIGYLCNKWGFSFNEYLLLIDFFYFGLMVVVSWKLMRSNMLVAVIFFFVSFSTFSYGTNGIRNGLACSITLLAVAMLTGKRGEQIIAVLLMFVAYSIHHSTFLPSFCAIAALLWCKRPVYAIYFWFASIFISLAAGDAVTQLFVDLGFDDRMENYANLTEEEAEILETPKDPFTGFRIDFVIYSIIPLIMAWYVTVKRHFNDRTYNIIAATYILANAFWVMVIRSEQSNRFAYLSWFIYPLVIAYPLLRMKLWEDQDRKMALILLAYAGFTFTMHFVYYG